jgi:hypothetical protein
MNPHTDRTIPVLENPRGAPQAFSWRGRRVNVRQILDDWEEEGCWWLDEEPRRVYRVLGHDDTLYELHQFVASGWRLFRTYD